MTTSSPSFGETYPWKIDHEMKAMAKATSTHPITMPAVATSDPCCPDERISLFARYPRNSAGIAARKQTSPTIARTSDHTAFAFVREYGTPGGGGIAGDTMSDYPWKSCDILQFGPGVSISRRGRIAN